MTSQSYSESFNYPQLLSIEKEVGSHEDTRRAAFIFRSAPLKTFLIPGFFLNQIPKHPHCSNRPQTAGLFDAVEPAGNSKTAKRSLP